MPQTITATMIKLTRGSSQSQSVNRDQKPGDHDARGNGGIRRHVKMVAPDTRRPSTSERLWPASATSATEFAKRCRRGSGGNEGGVISEWINDSHPALARRRRSRHGEE